MMGYLNQAREHGVQVSAMWIQDWSGKIVTGFGTRVFWNWRWNDTWYPDLDNIIQVSNNFWKIVIDNTQHFIRSWMRRV